MGTQQFSVDGRQVVVVGAARSGVAAAELLASAASKPPSAAALPIISTAAGALMCSTRVASHHVVTITIGATSATNEKPATPRLAMRGSRHSTPSNVTPMWSQSQGRKAG